MFSSYQATGGQLKNYRFESSKFDKHIKNVREDPNSPNWATDKDAKTLDGTPINDSVVGIKHLLTALQHYESAGQNPYKDNTLTNANKNYVLMYAFAAASIIGTPGATSVYAVAAQLNTNGICEEPNVITPENISDVEKYWVAFRLEEFIRHDCNCGVETLPAVGINNTGNRCHINAMLQVVMRLPPVLDYILNDQSTSTIFVELRQLSNTIRNLNRHGQPATDSPEVSLTLFNAIHEKTDGKPSIDYDKQHDPQEDLVHLMEHLAEHGFTKACSGEAIPTELFGIRFCTPDMNNVLKDGALIKRPGLVTQMTIGEEELKAGANLEEIVRNHCIGHTIDGLPQKMMMPRILVIYVSRIRGASTEYGYYHSWKHPHSIDIPLVMDLRMKALEYEPGAKQLVLQSIRTKTEMFQTGIDEFAQAAKQAGITPDEEANLKTLQDMYPSLKNVLLDAVSNWEKGKPAVLLDQILQKIKHFNDEILQKFAYPIYLKFFNTAQTASRPAAAAKVLDQWANLNMTAALDNEVSIMYKLEENQQPPTTYHLYGATIHSGNSPTSGHYYSYVKELLDEASKFNCYNDSTVSKGNNYANIAKTMGSSASLIIYVRADVWQYYKMLENNNP
jgi:hypothetical protein